jgi:uncharacterized protein YggT (Ycf19 family)
MVDRRIPDEPRLHVHHTGGLVFVLGVIDFLFYLLYALLALRFALVLVNARPEAGFVRFVMAVTAPFYAPFARIVPSPVVAQHEIALPVLIALLVYLLLHSAIRRLLLLFARERHVHV